MLDGRVIGDMPATRQLAQVTPVYRTLPGWVSDTRGVRRIEDLPENARAYVRFIEEFIGVHRLRKNSTNQITIAINRR
jgi:adenylosuccinate synthase